MIATIQALEQLPTLHASGDSVLYLDEGSGSESAVVIKTFAQPYATPQQAIRLANEFSLTRDVEHPGIRRAIASTTIDGKQVLILAYVPGRTVYQSYVLERRSLGDILSLGVSAAMALGELHRRGIIHKNVTSHHVLVREPEQEAVLIDFAISARVDRRRPLLGIPEHVEGSLAYVSPEQTGRMNRGMDHRTDLYSLGVVLYEMLTASTPFVGKDDAEVVHGHIAKLPRAVSDVDTSVPRAVSDVVMKLLAKNPEDRYQSAFGLAEDLRDCRRQLQESGSIGDFTAGARDLSGRLTIPPRLYGRDDALRVMAQALERARLGSGELVLLEGTPGSGKSALALDLSESVARANGLLVAGVCDQYQRTIPFLPLARAVRHLENVLLSRDRDHLERIGGTLQESLGQEALLLVKLFPHMEWLLGYLPSKGDPTPVEFDSTALQHRLHEVFRTFLQVIARPEEPLVLSIDDLHWADEASVNFLRHLLTRPELHHFLWFGTYCGESLAASHPLSILLADLEGGPLRLTKQRLAPLSSENVATMLADTLRCSPDEVSPLAALVSAKTGGTPLLVTEFLHGLQENGLLSFDFQSHAWTWELPQIQEHTDSGDVNSLMTRRLTSLEESVREVLFVAACIGDAFELMLVAEVSQRPWRTVLDELCRAVKLRLVLSLDQARTMPASDESGAVPERRFVFAHQRVRQACLTLMPSRRRRQIHLAVARRLNERCGPKHREERIFDLADHYNEGFRYVDNEPERLLMAEINLQAGRRAKHAAAYLSAIRYLSMGLGLLPRNRWRQCAALTRQLYLESIEAEYLTHNWERAALLVAEALEHLEPKERVRARRFQILICAAQGQSDKVLDVALTTLEDLGVLSRAELPAQTVDRGISERLDMATIVKASHLLSQEIHLGRLLHKLVRFALENAGAEKGALIVELEGHWVLQALGRADQEGIETLQAQPVEDSSQVPLSVLNYVTRTQLPLVLPDASQDPVYATDAYVAAHRVRSLLCIPIVYQAKLTGLLYLENNLVSEAFTPERLEVLRALSAQAAISMENASLYTSLEEKVRELGATKDALTISRNWLDRILNAIRDPIFVKDREHRFVLLNDALCQFVGRSREELLGRSDHDFFPRAQADVFWTKDEDVFTSGRENTNEETITDSQEVEHTILTKKALYTDDTGDQYIVGTIRDISERINLETRLRQAAKMEAVGTLAGGVAHDFNNLLTAIIGYSELLRGRIEDEGVLDEEAAKSVAEIKRAGESAAALTSQLLAFSRKRLLQPRLIDLNDVVTRTGKMLQRLIGEHIQLVTVLKPNLWQVTADPTLLEQVVMNLVINARDAMSAGGRLAIETSNAHLDELYASQHLEVSAGDYVLLSVSDNGVGMDKTTLSHIFEPFFTTKGKANGTGLGLATAYGVVKQSGGHIAVYSELDRGTTFKVYLPRDETVTAQPTTDVTEHGRNWVGSETILLVEDEQIVRALAAKVLLARGYTVLQAQDGAEALALLNNLKEPPQLLVSDMIMPGMDGSELARRVRLVCPGIKVIFVSGYSENVANPRGMLDSYDAFLQKPFSTEALAREVRMALDGK